MDRIKPRRLRLLHEIYLKQPIPIHTLRNIFKYEGVLNYLFLHLISIPTYSWLGLKSVPACTGRTVEKPSRHVTGRYQSCFICVCQTLPSYFRAEFPQNSSASTAVGYIMILMHRGLLYISEIPNGERDRLRLGETTE